MFFSSLILSVLVAFAQAQNLESIIFKTADGSKNNEMAEARGSVGISLVLAGGASCSVANLDEYANTFTVDQFRGNQGSMDVFQANDIGNCAGVAFGTTRLPTLVLVQHQGNDDYNLARIDFMLNDNTYTRCTVNQNLQGATSVTVTAAQCVAAAN